MTQERKSITVSDTKNFSSTLRDILIDNDLDIFSLSNRVSKVSKHSSVSLRMRFFHWMQGQTSPILKNIGELTEALDYDIVLVPRENTKDASA